MKRFLGQVESSETPEITKMTPSFTKVNKNLTKLKETLINYVWEKFHVKKQKEQNFPWIPGFRKCSMVKNENLETPEINRKISKSKSTQC